jgi:succinate dehydrogenase / fumarate reductase, cytochrome b subunit
MQKNTSRPISPHLPVYKMQLTSGLSIMHRATGFLLFVGLLAILWWLIYCIHTYGYSGREAFCASNFRDEIHQSDFFNFFAGNFGKIILIVWSYCLFYHLFAGVRHLFWDAGLGLDLNNSRLSGWFVLIASILIWAGNWAYILI